MTKKEKAAFEAEYEKMMLWLEDLRKRSKKIRSEYRKIGKAIDAMEEKYGKE